jgi:hypothetical protein
VWEITWVNDVTGKTLHQQRSRTADDALELSAPPFERHVVARLRWISP